MGPYAMGGPTCGDSWRAKWQCATSYLMELLHARVVEMEMSGHSTVIIPEAVDYDGIAHHILTVMNTDTRKMYPIESEWPVDTTGDKVQGGKPNRQPTDVNLHMREPWNAYHDLYKWMRALYRHYASEQHQIENPAPSDPHGLALVLFNIFSTTNQTLFIKQLHRWCKAAVPYHEHARYCPHPNAKIPELIAHIQTALQIFQPAHLPGALAQNLDPLSPQEPSMPDSQSSHTHAQHPNTDDYNMEGDPLIVHAPVHVDPVIGDAPPPPPVHVDPVIGDAPPPLSVHVDPVVGDAPPQPPPVHVDPVVGDAPPQPHMEWDPAQPQNTQSNKKRKRRPDAEPEQVPENTASEPNRRSGRHGNTERIPVYDNVSGRAPKQTKT